MKSEQMKAINTVRQKWGRNWKSKLMACWLASNYPGINQNDSAALQKIRNHYGPAWLKSYKTGNREAL